LPKIDAGHREKVRYRNRMLLECPSQPISHHVLTDVIYSRPHFPTSHNPSRITNMAETNYEAAISLIDEAHAHDPNIAIVNGKEVPYELHYAQQMSRYLEQHAPDASPVLKTAVRAQHFRRYVPLFSYALHDEISLPKIQANDPLLRWEVPRSSYPATKAGYFQWRTFLKKRQADLALAICIGCNYTSEEAEAVAALIRKEDLKQNEETQILEDVACLVFLDDQLEEFGKGDEEGADKNMEIKEDKIVDIIQKTWKKMSPRGQELALKLTMGERAKSLVGRALAG
jgi:hypothetical protein